MKILLPFDDTPAARAAVNHALGLRRAGLKASFVLVNVQPPPTLYEVVVAHDAERLDDVRRAAGIDLLANAEAMLAGSGAEWESEVAGGQPETALVDLAENYGCHAIVMGAGEVGPHGLGPVAQAVLLHSPVPVTLVRRAQMD
jgi:nucleotide-binding universal stress UspA family protein